MGRSIICTYVGAYFKVDMDNEEFKEILETNNFHKDPEEDPEEDLEDDETYGNPNCYYDKFQTPSEGLENMPVLLPHNGDDLNPVCIDIDNNEDDYGTETEIEFAAYDWQKYRTNLSIRYAKTFEVLKEWFGDKVRIAVGLVNYIDEIS